MCGKVRVSSSRIPFSAAVTCPRKLVAMTNEFQSLSLGSRMIQRRKFCPGLVASYLLDKRNETRLGTGPASEILKIPSIWNQRLPILPAEYSSFSLSPFKSPLPRLSTWSASSPCSLLPYRCSPSLTLWQSTLGNATSINVPQPFVTALASSIDNWMMAGVNSDASTTSGRLRASCTIALIIL